MNIKLLVNELGIAPGSFLLVLERFSHCCSRDCSEEKRSEKRGDGKSGKEQVSIGTSFRGGQCAVLRTVRFLCTGDGCGGRKRREANGSAESGRIVLAGEA